MYVLSSLFGWIILSSDLTVSLVANEIVGVPVGTKAAFPCMRIIYPTDFSRTDEMPNRKKWFHDTDIKTFFFAFSRAENRITRAENRMR